MTIRQILRSRTLATVLATVTCGTAWTAERKPNFLFVLTDDQRWDAMGVVQREMGDKGRYPWFKTPNMDKIAESGVRFRNAFVTLSLCAPSRAVFLTGEYNHVNGVANNHTPFPETNVTHATLLRPAGYVSGYIGKWHMGGQRGKRPGFDYSASFIGQGRYWDCPFEIDGMPTQTKGWVDDVSTSYAIEFIRQHKDQPFDLTVGYKACHGPNEPPDRARDRFANETARPVPNLDVRAIYRTEEDTTAPRKRGGINLNYFRCISAADDNLGLLLKTLDELKLTDDTVIVFAGDNGYYHGEHGLGDKRSMYDESLRIPMLIRYPKKFPKGKAIDEMVLNIDMAPTFLELAGVPVPKQMQGKSWVPLLTGKNKDWRHSFLCEYFQEVSFPQTPTMTGVRTDTAKLIMYPGHADWTEVFDLRADPYEIKNLANDPSSKPLLQKLTSEYDKQVSATAFLVPDYADKPGATLPKKPKAAARRNAEGAD